MTSTFSPQPARTLTQLLACWPVMDEIGLSLPLRITGLQGLGITTLVVSAAQERKQELYIFESGSDTRT
jgi:hypothetical protein